MIRLSWHGCAAFTLGVDGHEILVDPLFSPHGTYANPHAPTPYEYMATHRPERVVLTTGRADHCDIEAIKALTAIGPLEFVCSPAVAQVLARDCGIGDRHLTLVKPGDSLALDGFRLDVFPARPPAPAGAGGERDDAALELLVESSDRRIFLSGDTSVEAIPDMVPPVAVLCVGTRMKDSLTQAVGPHTLTPTEVPEVIRRLHARAVVAVAWDDPH